MGCPSNAFIALSPQSFDAPGTCSYFFALVFIYSVVWAVFQKKWLLLAYQMATMPQMSQIPWSLSLYFLCSSGLAL